MPSVVIASSLFNFYISNCFRLSDKLVTNSKKFFIVFLWDFIYTDF